MQQTLVKMTEGTMIELVNGDIQRYIPVRELQVDPTYQRSPIMSNVDRIRMSFNPNALGIIKVAQRKGTGILYVYDGWHRITAIRQRIEAGQEAPDKVLCIVTPSTTQKKEAQLFVQFNTSKTVNGNNRFRASVAFDNEPELTILRMVEAEGFTLAYLSPGRPVHADMPVNGIYSVASLLRAYNLSKDNLASALKLMRLWCGGGRANRVPATLRSGQVVLALSIFLSHRTGSIKSLVEHFAKINWDLASVWDEVKTTEGHGYDRPKELAARIHQALTGKRPAWRLGRAAA
jgi:hypothetical protein